MSSNEEKQKKKKKNRNISPALSFKKIDAQFSQCCIWNLICIFVNAHVKIVQFVIFHRNFLDSQRRIFRDLNELSSQTAKSLLYALYSFFFYSSYFNFIDTDLKFLFPAITIFLYKHFLLFY